MYTSVSNTETSILNLTPYIVFKTNKGGYIRYRSNIHVYYNRFINSGIVDLKYHKIAAF